MSKEDRISTVKDILYCDDSCSIEAYKEILDLWGGSYVKEIEKSKAISKFTSDELTLMNRLFGSDATCYSFNDLDIQKSLLKLMPHDLYKNFRKATYKRKMAITAEDWLWCVSDIDFLDDLDIELTCLENSIVSLLLYLLGGFKLPKDDKKKKMDNWLKVDVEYLFNRPRELFLLTSISPAILARFVYWKCTSVTMGLMRLFAKKVTSKEVINFKKKLIENGFKDSIRKKN